jgi:ATP-binding cassette subfamily F protein 3
MIRFINLQYNLGERDLYVDLNWHIKPGDRIGLVGDNGTGKTTLLRMLAGELEASGGEIQRAKGIRLGYLRQEIAPAGPEQTVLGEALNAFEADREAQNELHELYDSLATVPMEEHDEIYERIHLLEKRAFHKDLGALESDARKVLVGLGFLQDQLEQSLAKFSGGWQMRAHLARLLLEAPDVLLLDEPTNHLDLESIQWLEEFLVGFPGAIVVVSHDRTFLDRMTNKTAWLHQRKISSFAKNYSGFLIERAEQEDLLLRRYQNQQEELARQQQFIDRFRAKASKATLVQSRIKQLDKVERIELPASLKAVKLRIPEPEQTPRVPLEVRDAGKAYGSNRVLEGVNLQLRAGDKVALIGPNGAGKSTLLKILGGLFEFEGERLQHNSTRIEYFSQHRVDDLDPKSTILEAVKVPGITQTEEQLRTILGCFLFSGDDVFKPVGVLSGGERSRVALARIMLRRGNLLLLDEPTNHLDITTRDQMMKAMKEFPGTVVVVSHDRYFIEGLATRVVEVGGGKARVHEMGYADWLKEHGAGQDGEAALRGRLGPGSKTSKKDSESNPKVQAKVADNSRALETLAALASIAPTDGKKKESPEERRVRAEQRNKLSAKVKELEKQISRTEKRIAEIHGELGNPEIYSSGRGVELAREVKDLEAQLAQHLENWESASTEYEAVK